jgi:hypothetical protein
MEASHSSYLAVDQNRPSGSGSTGRSDRMIEVPTIDAHDDNRSTGFLRLHLMVSAVLERMTRQPTGS